MGDSKQNFKHPLQSLLTMVSSLTKTGLLAESGEFHKSGIGLNPDHLPKLSTAGRVTSKRTQLKLPPASPSMKNRSV